VTVLRMTEYEVHDFAAELHAQLSQTEEGAPADSIEIHPDQGQTFPMPREEFHTCEMLIAAIKVLAALLDGEIHEVAEYTC